MAVQQYQNSTRRSIAWLKKQEDENTLIMKPPFQRNPVWTDRQRSYLIDTVLRGYPIPELYMQETVDDAGNEKFIIVDGQQRVRACLEFIEGKYELNARDAPDWAEMTFEDLSPEDKKRFFGYSFIVRQLPDIPEEELRNIFKRLNRNVVALNKQELRHASYWGEFISTMERLADHSYWEGTGIFTANDIRRMLDVEFISELAIGHLHGPQNKKATLDRWYELYELEFEARKLIESVFNRVFGEFEVLLPEIRKSRWRKKSDFYSLFLLFAERHENLPLSEERRATGMNSLLQFASEVDKYLASGAGDNELVKRYSKAVERAASDLGNRKKRKEALEELLKPIFK